ncbi:hypothetical protein ACQJ8R_07840, partial [Helicobacter pylori]
HSTIQSFNQAINQAIKQSSNQTTLPYFYRFYKNLFKNPLFFIIPPFLSLYFSLFLFISLYFSLFLFISLYFSFINLHRNIFKPFDSISPIFKSVGLTELNSIQGEDNGSVRRFKSA